ncbi:MAG TPA: ADOP family duplicated permease [Gemmatimonadaceae bacterium]|nr:ADOP family duplicated permease [Gemmatimonadaceae bacterium]
MTRGEGFRRLFRLDRGGADVERAVDDELCFHFGLAVRELMAGGMSEADAQLEAERRFGDVERTRAGLAALDRARVAHVRRAERWSNVGQDLRYALRGLRRRPGFSAAIVLILALGIGANATMFGIVDRLLFRPPAFLPRASEVHRLYLAGRFDGKEFAATSTGYRRFREITDSAASISAAVAFWTTKIAVGVTDPEELRVSFATAGFWKLFDARPAIGRFFSEADDRVPAGTPVAVLSYGFWQARYGARDDVLGAQLRIGRFDYTIIGVAPKGFLGLSDDLPVAFIPLSSGADNSFGVRNPPNRLYHGYTINWLQIVVRRKPELSVAAATAELSRNYQRSYAAQRAEQPGSPPEAEAKPHVVVGSILTQRGPNQGTDTRVAIWLVGVALIVLVIACANVSNLLLARALQRRREIAVRLALGISRRRLLAQLLVESVLLALLGGAAGIALAASGGGLLRATLLPGVTWTNTLGDGRMLLFAAVVTLATGGLTGLAPALHAVRYDVSNALKAGSREGTYQRSRLRSALLVLQSALSVVLLVGAGLFVRSLDHVQALRLGYDPEHLALVTPNLRGVVLDSTSRETLFRELLRAAQALPGVRAAAHTASVPFYSDWEEPLFVSGIDSVSRLGSFVLSSVSPDYFDATGTRIVQGRGITGGDRLGTPGAMVVSQSMAAKLWPGRDPIGQCVRVRADTMPCSYVVGMAEDIRRGSLTDDAGLQYYLAREQFSTSFDYLFVRTSGTAESSGEAIRRGLQRVMPGASYVTVMPMTGILSPVRRSWQLGATMFTLFGALALIVAGVGLYSVISFNVAQRTQELSVRVALGARTHHVMRLVLTDAVGVALLAVALGAGAALLASRWVKPLLFATSPHDAAVYGTVTTVLVAVALVAGLVPALRAARVDPSGALRAD